MKPAMSLILLFLLLCAPARAEDKRGTGEQRVELSDVVVCATKEQVERYVALYRGDRDAAVRAVNREKNDPSACGVASVAFVRGSQLGTARAENIAFEIVRILVLGIDSQDGFRTVRPASYFAAFGVTEYDV